MNRLQICTSGKCVELTIDNYKTDNNYLRSGGNTRTLRFEYDDLLKLYLDERNDFLNKNKRKVAIKTYVYDTAGLVRHVINLEHNIFIKLMVLKKLLVNKYEKMNVIFEQYEDLNIIITGIHTYNAEISFDFDNSALVVQHKQEAMERSKLKKIRHLLKGDEHVCPYHGIKAR